MFTPESSRKEMLMRVLGPVLLACATFFLVPGNEATGGQGKKKATSAEKILGKWEATKGEIPAGAVLEFSKDGKVKVTLDLKGTEVLIAWSGLQGTYQVVGDKLTTVRKVGGKEVTEAVTIRTLNETTLVLQDSRGKAEEFKRKK
jgi:uncharacterized protein (TIGR03066 family)